MNELGSDWKWKEWVERYDRMQERYIAERGARFERIAEMVGCSQKGPQRVLDLGCGTGSLSLAILESLPEAQVYGIDLDPTILSLARARTAAFGGRAVFIQADMRKEGWAADIPGSFDAAVSATALHWLNAEQLARVYRQIGMVLKPGGIFLNVDHAKSEAPVIQCMWEQQREAMLAEKRNGSVDDWEGFWSKYLEALGPGAKEARAAAVGEWEGSEEGLPLAWHFDRLRECGFSYVDCFWRCGCDAIFGGVKG